MRMHFTAAIVVFSATIAQAQSEPRAIVEKAIEAHGGAAVLDKFVAGRAKSKGTIVLQNMDFPFTSSRVYQTPGRMRTTFELVAANLGRPVTCIINGDRVASFAGGMAQEMPRSQVDELKTAVYVQNLVRLTPLLKDAKYRLAAAGEKSIDGQSAVGIAVTSDGHKEVRLFFDKQTGLLIALERLGHNAQGRAVDQSEFYSGYREASGLKYPTKTLVKQGGKKYLESEITEFKPLEKVDLKEFSVNPS